MGGLIVKLLLLVLLSSGWRCLSIRRRTRWGTLLLSEILWLHLIALLLVVGILLLEARLHAKSLGTMSGMLAECLIRRWVLLPILAIHLLVMHLWSTRMGSLGALVEASMAGATLWTWRLLHVWHVVLARELGWVARSLRLLWSWHRPITRHR